MKEKKAKKSKYFTPVELVLWLGGIAIIAVGFALGEDKNYLSLISSILGISCVMLCAKGNVFGQVVAIGFAITYGILAYTKAYYGEMLIYFVLMTPIHVASIITWLKNTNNKARVNEVKVNDLSRREYALCGLAVCVLTVAFYFLLKLINTDNLIVSTISLITSLGAAYLMLRRSEYYNVCFIANDIVLIILWSLKIPTDGLSLLPSVLTFVIFLATDTYSFINWKRLKRRQRGE